MSAKGMDKRDDNGMGGKDHWETPKSFFEDLDEIYGFTIDLAASATNSKCERFLSGPHKMLHVCHCGLCEELEGEVCFLNPPYNQMSNAIHNGVPTRSLWIKRAIELAQRGNVVTGLFPNATDSRWFELAARNASEIWFPTSRIQFEINGQRPINPNTGLPSGNAGGSVVMSFWPDGTRSGSTWGLWADRKSILGQSQRTIDLGRLAGYTSLRMFAARASLARPR